MQIAHIDGLYAKISAGLSPFNNLWYSIHDFSQDSSEKKNFQILGKFYKVSDFLPKCDAVDSVLEIDHEKSLVPQLIKSDSSEEETSVIVVFNDGHSNCRLSMDTKSKLS